MTKGLKKEVDKVIEALEKDVQYRDSWKANIACCFKDAWDSNKKLSPMIRGIIEVTPEFIHEVANEGAERLLDILCGSGVRRPPTEEEEDAPDPQAEMKSTISNFLYGLEMSLAMTSRIVAELKKDLNS